MNKLRYIRYILCLVAFLVAPITVHGCAWLHLVARVAFGCVFKNPVHGCFFGCAQLGPRANQASEDGSLALPPQLMILEGLSIGG